MNKNKSKYHRVPRADFVESRYRRFKESQALIGALSDAGLVHRTDLDEIDPDSGKPIRDLVLCDRCNEDILDSSIVTFCSSRVYHKACAKTYTGYDLRPEEPPVSWDNVIALYAEEETAAMNEQEMLNEVQAGEHEDE